VSYDTLLDVFWRNVDPFRKNAQFCDSGTQYRAAIYYGSPEEKAAAEASLKAVQARFNTTVFTELGPAETFYDAEDYHQDYYVKNPLKYKYYRYRCGRDQRLQALWGEEAGAVAIIKKHNASAEAASAE
jgi:peptide-methionine (S)-S-oxide reductase